MTNGSIYIGEVMEKLEDKAVVDVDKNSDFYVACEFNFTGIFPSLYIGLLGNNITDQMEQQVS